MTSVPAIAGEDMPTGVFVRLEGDQAFIDTTLKEVGGVARLPWGKPWRESLSKGEEIEVLTDGGCLARVLESVDLKVRRTTVRKIAGENQYFHLADGRITGFQGDDHLR
jgi:hypothetical protein